MDDLSQTIALTLGAGWASGINLYAAILVLGLLGATGQVDLPTGLEILSNPLVLAGAGTMYVVEFFADKVPGVDTLWDGLSTFVRIPAGAMMAAGAVPEIGPGTDILAAFVGGGMATAAHTAKASSRVAINTSPEPFSNWAASIGEDIAVVVGLFTALNHPILFIVLIVVFLLLLAWLLPKLWRGIKAVFRAIGRLFGGGGQDKTGQGKATEP